MTQTVSSVLGPWSNFYITTGAAAASLTDLEDWAWYTILPLLAYGAILAGAIMLWRVPVNGLFALAAGVILLSFLGIRNAWDIVTFIATGASDEPPSAK